mmetsp:Transcript_11489/g.42905  ORF Transcript_11489/g.42905 Transcript_11489/m.42905 type:complete len:219 (+) Transcript_11489:211-867(+)
MPERDHRSDTCKGEMQDVKSERPRAEEHAGHLGLKLRIRCANACGDRFHNLLIPAEDLAFAETSELQPVSTWSAAASSSFIDDDDARRDVPRPSIAVLVVGVDDSRRDPCHIHTRGAQVAQPADIPAHEVLQSRERHFRKTWISRGANVVDNESLADVLRAAHMDGPPIQLRTPVLARFVQLVQNRIVNHAKHRFSPVQQADADAHHREAMDKVRRAV